MGQFNIVEHAENLCSAGPVHAQVRGQLSIGTSTRDLKSAGDTAQERGAGTGRDHIPVQSRSSESHRAPLAVPHSGDAVWIAARQLHDGVYRANGIREEPPVVEVVWV